MFALSTKRSRILAFVVLLVMVPLGEAAAETDVTDEDLAWWVWTIMLFVLCFLIGILAVVGGVGGGVLFVPIVSGFFPFHLDFVRGAGLMIALAGGVSASPRLLRKGLASLRMALPVAVVGSISSIAGAILGLSLPTDAVQTGLGVAIIGIAILMIAARGSNEPALTKADALSEALRISGVYQEPSTGGTVDWRLRRTPVVLVLFAVIGFMAGLFGLGAGWANVPALNLVWGAPLKLAVATNWLILSLNHTAMWVYFGRGAILPLIAVPSVAGMMLGTRIGVLILTKAKVRAVKTLVLVILFLAGIRSILSGQNIWV